MQGITPELGQAHLHGNEASVANKPWLKTSVDTQKKCVVEQKIDECFAEAFSSPLFGLNYKSLVEKKKIFNTYAYLIYLVIYPWEHILVYP